MRKLLIIAAITLLCLAGVPTEGYVLTVTPDVAEVGDVFETCLEVPVDSLALLILSDGPGPTPSPYGDLAVSFPFTFVLPLVVPAGEPTCFPHLLHCEDVLVGISASFQFVAFSFDMPPSVGVSNPETLEVLDGGCLSEGDFLTFTQGGWGAKCAGNNPGCLRDEFFDLVFDDHLALGSDPLSASGDRLLRGLALTDSAAVAAFLPEGGPAAQLSGDEIDLTESSAGVLAGQMVAAVLNVSFDDAGVFDAYKDKPQVKLRDLVFSSDGGTHPAIVGRSVGEMLGWAHRCLSGQMGPLLDLDGDLVADIGLSDLVECLDAVNNCFDGGTVYDGSLVLP